MKKFLVIGVITFFLVLLLGATRVWSGYLPVLHLRGATLGSLSSDLLLSNKEHPEKRDYQSYGELHGAQNLLPGGEEGSEFFWIWSKNTTTSLRILAQFTAGDGDWSRLATLIEVQVAPEGKQATAPWFLLSQYSQYPFEVLPLLGPGEEKKIVVRYRMISRYSEDPDGSGPLAQGDYLGEEVQELRSGGIGLELTAVRHEE